MLFKRWIATCDHTGCPTVIVIDPIPGGDKWDYGQALNDAGWQAAPAVKETRCPEHAIDHEAFIEEIERRRAPEIAKYVNEQALALSEAFSNQQDRRKR